MSIKVTGFNVALARLKSMPARLETELKNELKASADKIRKNAAKDAPADVGKLRNSIITRQNSDLNYSVIVQNSYAAFQEWGTKGQANVPTELKDYAAQFKGIKGSGELSPVDALQAWVKRKGLAGTYNPKTKRRQGGKMTKEKQDRQLAFLIWRKIKKYGIKPHPFFFKHVFAERERLNKTIINIFSKL